MNTFTRRHLIALSTATALLALGTITTASAQAQAFPAKSIKMVVPIAPGGSTDVTSRHLAVAMSSIIGHPVVVENKPGVAGGLGINGVARSDPDGYTIGISGVGPTITLNLTGAYTQYIALRDLAFIAHMNVTELVMLTRRESPISGVKDLIAAAKSRPVTMGNSGTFGPVHLANALMCQMTSIECIHVPYKGDSLIIQDLLGGQIDAGSVSVASSVGLIRSGQMKSIAMLGATRSAVFSDLPTAAEQGLVGYEASLFQIVVAPAKTPAPVIARLNDVINQALSTSKMRDEYAKLGSVPTGGSPKDAADFVARETAKWAKVLQQLGPEK